MVKEKLNEWITNLNANIETLEEDKHNCNSDEAKDAIDLIIKSKYKFHAELLHIKDLNDLETYYENS